MKDYYRNASLTLSALESPDSYCGIFQERKGIQCIPLPSGSTLSNLYMRVPLPESDTIFSKSVLNGRAWVLQERLLSTRILHYGEQELFWECNTCSMREGSMREEIDRSLTFSSHYLSEGGDFKRLLSQLIHIKDLASVMATWYRLVTQYTKRALTRHSDRLPAIAGIASIIAAVTGYRYLAGLWKEDTQGLLWFTVTTNQLSPTYLAPSWSWASTADLISFRYESEIAITSPEDAQIIDSEVNNIGQDRFGQVGFGYINLRATGMDLQYDSSLGKLGTRKLPKLLKNSAVQSEDARFLSHYEYQPAFGEVFLDDANYSVSNKNIDEERRRLCTVVFIQRRIPSNVAAYVGALQQKRAQSKIYCLILQQCKEYPAEWKRIGIAMTYDGPVCDFVERGLGEWSPPREFKIV